MYLIPTPSQTAGPYLHLGLTKVECLSRAAGNRISGERIQLLVRIFDGDGLPVPDAVIELWQADADGNYPDSTYSDTGFRGFGRMPTSEDGACRFETIKPGRVKGAGNTMQAPHVNVSVMARGLLKRLATRVYFAEEPSNAVDTVLASVPESRRWTLFAHRDAGQASLWRFDVRLRGEGETVFFDV